MALNDLYYRIYRTILFLFKLPDVKMGKILFFLTILIHWNNSFCMEVIRDNISNITMFYYRKLSKFPSKLETIEYTIIYNFHSPYCYPGFDIYTTESDQSFCHQCITNGFGQLQNENLGVPLRQGCYRSSKWEFIMNHLLKLKCTGKTTIQDYVLKTTQFLLDLFVIFKVWEH